MPEKFSRKTTYGIGRGKTVLTTCKSMNTFLWYWQKKDTRDFIAFLTNE